MSTKGYTPEITVVRRTADVTDPSWWTTELNTPTERAYLVRGLPMPGEKVVDHDGRVGVVEGVWAWVDRTIGHAKGRVSPYDLRPYDPDEVLVERVAKAIRDATVEWGDPIDEADRRLARAAIAAMREAP